MNFDRLKPLRHYQQLTRNTWSAIAVASCVLALISPSKVLATDADKQATEQENKARSKLQESIKIAPNSAAAHRELGIYYLHTRDLVAANNELSRALQLDHSDTAAARSLIGLWQEQLLKAPNANSHFGLARAYQLSGALDSAQAEFREVVRLDPTNPALPAARQSFKRELARQEAAKDLQQAETLEAQGHLNEAYQLVGQAMVYSPGNTSYKLYQAELLTKLGQPGMAKQIYLNVLKDDPENQTAMQNIHLLPNYSNTASNSAPNMVPGTNVPLPPAADQVQAAVLSGSLQPPAAVTPEANKFAPASGIDPLSSFLRQLRDKVFDQNENQSGTEINASPVADPAGMLHGM